MKNIFNWFSKVKFSSPSMFFWLSQWTIYEPNFERFAQDLGFCGNFQQFSSYSENDLKSSNYSTFAKVFVTFPPCFNQNPRALCWISTNSLFRNSIFINISTSIGNFKNKKSLKTPIIHIFELNFMQTILWMNCEWANFVPKCLQTIFKRIHIGRQVRWLFGTN